MKDEALLKLLQEKEMWKNKAQDYKDVLIDIKSSFICIGGPLNDNKLKFNYDQLIYLNKLKNMIRMVL